MGSSLNYIIIINLLVIIICALVCIAFFTIAERKVMAAIQRRKGPNVVGIFGTLQPLADGLKLLIKEIVIPLKSNWKLFLVSPLLVLSLSFTCWVILPFTLEKDNSLTSFFFLKKLINYQFNDYFITLNNWFCFYDFTGNAYLMYGILILLIISSLNVYGIIIAGWSSYSKYAFFGALRSAAQMISYEVSITLVLLPIIFLSGSMNLTEIVWVQMHSNWYFITLFPTFVLFLISIIAETNRAPFDLPEAEAELVAGYNVEYSSIIFAMFFLGEYSNMIIMSALITTLFFGGWSGNFFLNHESWLIVLFIAKILFFCFIYILIRASLPRYRYDQLMEIGWKFFLPWALCFMWAILIINLNMNLNIYQIEVLSINNFAENRSLFSNILTIDSLQSVFSGEICHFWRWIWTLDFHTDLIHTSTIYYVNWSYDQCY